MSTTLPITQLIKLFIADQDVSELSKSLYRRFITLFFQWVNANKLDYNLLKRVDILQYKAELMEDKSPLTVDSYLTSVRKFYKWAAFNGYFDNIANGIKSPRRYKGFKKQVLTVDQVQQLLTSVDRTTLKGKRNYAILALLAVRALRTIELHRANVGDIELMQGVKVLWLQRKNHTSKDEYAEIDDNVYDAIEEYLTARGNIKDSEPLFTSLSPSNRGQRMTTRTYSGIVKEQLRSIGIDDKRITAHSLRHTVATILINQGVSLYEVQLYLGHSSPAITEIYTRMAEQQQRLINSPSKRLTKLYNISPNKQPNEQISGVTHSNSRKLKESTKNHQKEAI